MSERYSLGWTDLTVRRVLSGEIAPDDQPLAVLTVMQHDMRHSSAGMGMEMVMTEVHDDNIYRVSIFPDGIDILCFGLCSLDSGIDGHYDRTDDLPNWVKERIAVLMITSGIPPTQEVVGVGRRISSHVYWVYAPERT